MDRKDEQDASARPFGERLKRALFREPSVVLFERGPDSGRRQPVENLRDFAA